MSDEYGSRGGGRRKRTTRRLVRHPSRLSSEPNAVAAAVPQPGPVVVARVSSPPEPASPARPLPGLRPESVSATPGPGQAADAAEPSFSVADDAQIDVQDDAQDDVGASGSSEVVGLQAASPQPDDDPGQGGPSMRDPGIGHDGSDGASSAAELDVAEGGDAEAVAAESTPAPLPVAVEPASEPDTVAEPAVAAPSAAPDESGDNAEATQEEAASAPAGQGDALADTDPSLPPLQASSDASAVGAAARDFSAAEVETKPKIRLPDGATRRHSPRPPGPSGVPSRRTSSAPPPAAGPATPVPAGPDLAARVRTSVVPTGEGIVRRSSLPPAVEGGRSTFNSDVPTRPRIPLTSDMARAAGRVTSLDVPRYDDGQATSPRISVPPAMRQGAGEDNESAVVVTRSRVVSDHPPAPDLGEPERPRVRPSRRAHPESEEFETLDLEDGEEQANAVAVEASAVAEARGRDSMTRVPRTPPPPPAAQGSRRGQGATGPRGAPPPPPPTVANKRSEKAERAERPAAHKAHGKRRGWWEVLFSDDYVRTLPTPTSAQIAKQVNFMEASCGIARSDAVLDVGCGLGYHALEFARRGYLVVALDLALSMITRAAEAAQQQGLRINFLHKDIRDIGFEGTFDAVVCVGTTFGFFDDEQNRGVLLRLANALKPGGRLLLDVVNRDYVLASQPNLVWFEGEGCVVMEESDFNFYTSRLNVKRTMMREDGRQTESEYSIRLYSVHELGQMLKHAGFGIKEVSGQEATPGVFFGANSSRIIMLAERRVSGRKRGESKSPESGS